MFHFLYQFCSRFQIFFCLVRKIVYAYLSFRHIEFLVHIVSGNQNKAGHIGIVHIDCLNPHIMRRHVFSLGGVQSIVDILHPGLICIPAPGQSVFQNKGFVAFQFNINKIADFLGQGSKSSLISLCPETAALTAIAREIVAQFIRLHLQIILHVQILHLFQSVKRKIQYAIVFRIIEYKIPPVHIGQEVQHRLWLCTVNGHPFSAADTIFRGNFQVGLLSHIQLLRIQRGRDTQAFG